MENGESGREKAEGRMKKGEWRREKRWMGGVEW